MITWSPMRVVRLRRLFDEIQEDFARRIRVSTPCLRDWEQGKTPCSGIATLALELLEQKAKENQARARQTV